MRFCELKEKEVVNICNGKCLGGVVDLQINVCSGAIEAFRDRQSSVDSLERIANM